MSYYKSSKMNKKNEESWKKNLAVGGTRRRNTPIIEIISNYIRLPPNEDITRIYNTLLEHTKNKMEE